MNDVEQQHLVKMVQQIGDNLAHNQPADVAAPLVVAHINRFWAPAMKTKLVDYVGSNSSEQLPLVVAVVGLIG